MSFMKAVKHRRSVYSLGKEEVVPKDTVTTIVSDAVLHTPSPFNSQSGRVVVLFGKESDRFWKLVGDSLKPLVPPDAFGKTQERLDGFSAGYGTVLFFEDEAVVTGLQEQYSLYADKFPVWSLQSNGMLEFVVWTALEEAGLGASLQHYNPVVDDKVKAAWNVPASWKLLAQIPFGKDLNHPVEKEFSPLEGRLKVYG